MVFEMVKDIKVVFGKGRGSRLVPSDDGRAPIWKKKSMFWDLPYWEALEVRNAIDVMHLTENLCVNLLGFLVMYGKPKIHWKHGNNCNVCNSKLPYIQK
jgi:hypothetical protein